MWVLKRSLEGLFLFIFSLLPGFIGAVGPQDYEAAQNCDLFFDDSFHNPYARFKDKSLEAAPEELKIHILNSQGIYNYEEHFGKRFGKSTQGSERRIAKLAEKHVEILRDYFLQNQPDIVGMVEVESVEAAKRFQQKELKGLYRLFIGRERSPMVNAYFVKKSLPFSVRFFDGIDIALQDSLETPLFPHGLPILELYPSGRDLKEEPSMRLVLTHQILASKWMKGYSERKIKQLYQVEALKRVLKVACPNDSSKPVPCVLLGDFNVNFSSRKDMESSTLSDLVSLDYDYHFQNSLDAFQVDPSEKETSYSSHRSKVKVDQRDAVLLSPHFFAQRNRLLSAEVLPLFYKNKEIPRPRNSSDILNRTMDHQPVEIRVDVEGLFN